MLITSPGFSTWAICGISLWSFTLTPLELPKSLKFQNISGLHCEFTFHIGYWNIKDLGSSNGVKVNDHKLMAQMAQVLKPGDVISIASYKFKLQYETEANFAEMGTTEENIMGRSLLEKAGLEKPKKRAD